jgi:uncharacterized membrane protein
MRGLLIAALCAYGLRLSRTSTENIERLRQEAETGNQDAREHFTQTRYARVLGPRNSDLGRIYYAAVGLATLTGLIRRPLVLFGLRLASLASAVLSLYLLWALIVRLRVRCNICLQGHAVNFALLFLLLRSRPRSH